MHPYPKISVFLSFLILSILAACAGLPTGPDNTSSPAGTEVTIAIPPQTLAVSSPSPSSTASPPPQRTLVILVAPEGSDPLMVESVEAKISELASEEGFDVEVRTTLTAANLTPQVRVVVALPPVAESLPTLAASAPEIQFLGIGVTGQPTSNLNLIHLDGANPDQVGFLAGYLAAVVTPEWRVGALTTSDTPGGLAVRQGFLNGVVFFCGLCRQTFPPYYTYPLYAELPAASSAQEWQAASNTLVDQAVQTAYIGPGVGDGALLETLAGAGIWLIGSQSPPAALRDQWVATVSQDIPAALLGVWPDLVAGEGGVEIHAPLMLSDINPELFSPGRQFLVEELITELQNGYIDTGVSSGSVSP